MQDFHEWLQQHDEALLDYLKKLPPAAKSIAKATPGVAATTAKKIAKAAPGVALNAGVDFVFGPEMGANSDEIIQAVKHGATALKHNVPRALNLGRSFVNKFKKSQV